MLNPGQERAADLSCSSVVTAGAGSGKTRVLVTRYLRAVETAGHNPERVLAITFTEKAAGEMKERVRLQLEAMIQAGDQRWEATREAMAWAPIGTIHSLCAALLREYPIRSGVDPGFTVIEETDRRILCADVAAESVDLLAEEGHPDLGVLAGHWSRRYLQHRVAEVLEDSRLLAWATQAVDEPPKDALARWRGVLEARQAEALAALAAKAAVVTGLQALRAKHPDAAEEALAGQLVGWRRLCSVLLTKAGSPRARSKPEWLPVAEALVPYHQLLGLELVPGDEDVAEALLALARICLQARARYVEECEERQSIDFDGLQQRALQLLRRHPELCRSLRGRYSEVLVDEAQDTSPNQWALIELLVTGEQQELPSGGFFAVGDPKQSIYGFRGAEPAQLAKLGERLEAGGGRSVVMDVSYRMAPAPLSFCNTLFGELFDPPEPLSDGRQAEDPGAVELLLVSAEQGAGPAADALAELVATRLVRLIDSRGLAPHDCALLIRSRTHLRRFEAALWRYGLPYVVAGGVGFFQRREVLDLFSLLALLHDDRDDVALATTLRSPLFSLSDAALYRIKAFRSGSLLHALRSRGAELEGADQEQALFALHVLDQLRSLAGRVSAGELLRTAVEWTGYGGVLAADAQAEQALANVEKLIQLLRSETGPLGPIVRRLDRLLSEAERESQAAVSVEGREGVRVMTIHAAKGLEFPVVAVADLGARTRTGASDAMYIGRLPGCAGFDLGPKLQGLDRSGSVPLVRSLLGDVQRQARQAEERRLLYVACTRARDVLLLGAQLGKAQPGSADRPIDLMRSSLGLGWSEAQVEATLKRTTLPPGRLAPGLTVPIVTASGDMAEVAPLPEEVLAGDVVASWAEADDEPQPDDPLALAASRPWSAPGRPDPDQIAAVLVGTIVHRVLEHVEALGMEGARRLVQRMAEESGLDEGRQLLVVERSLAAVRTLLADSRVRGWLGSPGAYSEAAFVSEDDEGRPRHGRMDLYLSEENNTVVDWKTGALTEGYAAQVRDYMQAVEAATGRAARGLLVGTRDAEMRDVHLTPGGQAPDDGVEST